MGRSQGQIRPLRVGWPLAGRSPRLARASSASRCAKEPEVRLGCLGHAWCAWVVWCVPGAAGAWPSAAWACTGARSGAGAAGGTKRLLVQGRGETSEGRASHARTPSLVRCSV